MTVLSFSSNAARTDFNDDGRDDILWRHQSGEWTDWLGEPDGGFTHNYINASGQVPTSWQVAGTGDFNGDGRDDILWRNDSGEWTEWLGQTNGGFTYNYVNASGQVPTSWHVAGTGDFNGDGRDDILWRNESGALTDWLGQPNGGFATNHDNAWNEVSTSWHVAGTGDFNGDGRDDILWRHDSGEWTEWLGQTNGGFTYNYVNASGQVPTSWHVAGTGDFNGDGRDDILWRNESGALTDWLGQPNGGFVTNHANAWNEVSTSWNVVGTGDFNGDGRDDILWRHDSGTLIDWLATESGGFTSNEANSSAFVPPEWLVQPVTGTPASGSTVMGTEGDDRIFGGDGNDTIFGLGGEDDLDGGEGSDILYGGADADQFVFTSSIDASNIDSIPDFNAAEDQIVLYGQFNFPGTSYVGDGPLPAEIFRVGSAALDANDYIIHNPDTGALLYDPDGSGASAAVQFAILPLGVSLATTNFVLGLGDHDNPWDY